MAKNATRAIWFTFTDRNCIGLYDGKISINE